MVLLFISMWFGVNFLTDFFFENEDIVNYFIVFWTVENKWLCYIIITVISIYYLFNSICWVLVCVKRCVSVRLYKGDWI